MEATKPTSENLPDDKDVKRGIAIIDYVSAGLGAVSGGLSESVMLPIRRAMEKRVQLLEEAIVQDLRDGLIAEGDIIDEDRLASFILRVRRAAFEGVGKKKLRLMGRIFFKSAKGDDYSEDTLFDFWGITEQLNTDDMKVLAVLKQADLNGYFDQPAGKQRENRRIAFSLDRDGLFEDERSFNEASGALLRFGLVDAVTAWSSLVYFATDRCISYIRHLNFEELDDP